jgi:hypothetical protein
MTCAPGLHALVPARQPNAIAKTDLFTASFRTFYEAMLWTVVVVLYTAIWLSQQQDGKFFD